MNLSTQDATTILTLLSAVVIPFAVIWLQKLTWPDALKFALAILLSLIAGGLTAYIAGQVVLSGSLIHNAAVIFSAAQIVYYGAFRTLGLERVLFPQEALANHAQAVVADQVSGVSREAAKDVLNMDSSSTLIVNTAIRN